MTRDQPCDMLPMRVISPLRTYQSVPFTSRTWVTRTLTYSTMPVASPRSTTSPMPDLVFGDDEDAVQDVLDDVLRAEAETGADRRGQQRERAEGVRGEHGDDHDQRDDHDRHVDDVLQDRAERARALHDADGGERGALERLGVVDVRLVLGARHDAVHDAPDDELEDPAEDEGADDDAGDAEDVQPDVDEHIHDRLPRQVAGSGDYDARGDVHLGTILTTDALAPT